MRIAIIGTGAAANADVVILTVPWTAMDQTLRQFGDLPGTVVVDVSYPYSKREREALRGRSTAEVIQEQLPSARVFKGWNHVHARHLTDPEVDVVAASVLIAGDDPEAKGIVFAMARDMGFHPVDAGAAESDPRPGEARRRDALRQTRSVPGLVPTLNTAGAQRSPW